MDPLPKSGQPEYIKGQWNVNAEGILSQTGNREQCLALCKSVIDNDHYTVKCRARKDSGAEGFIIVFNYVDDKNYCWVNFGGWTNSQHAIEQISNGGKLLADSKRGRVEPGRWYDVTLQVAGDSVKAWLDNELVFDTVLKHDDTKGVFSSATIDDASGELIVKVANTSDAATTARLNLKNFKPASREHARYTHCHPSCGATALTREWQHSAGCTSLLAEYRQDQVSSSKEGSGVV